MTFPRPICAVLFDMDGTLLDTERLYARAISAACRDMDCAAEEVFFHQMLGRSWPHCHRLMQERFGARFSRECFDGIFEMRFASLIANGIPLKPGVTELLSFLAARALPMAVATSAWRETAQRHLRGSGILHHFSALATRENVEQGKPAPDTFLKAADMLGVEPQNCLALEDSPAGVRAAASAGAMTIMIPDVVPATPAEDAVCLAVVKSMSDVLHLMRAVDHTSATYGGGLERS